ncbi:hypothetical protein KIW84_034940 [Lathyrus oleraceus]|uniref:Post-SET domain-containing protein n=1 Tax=Pisum sativum TaxID=3888 RepID=A0A9D4Y2D4_PEA|nr:hypothetical protein KIW84_034940 [Pisum sativum]
MDPSHPMFPKRERDSQYQLSSKRRITQNDELSSFGTSPQHQPIQVTYNCGPSFSKTGLQVKPHGPSSSKTGSQLKPFQVNQNCKASSSKPFKVSNKIISSRNFNTKKTSPKVQRTTEPKNTNSPLFKISNKKDGAKLKHLRRHSDDASSSYIIDKEKQTTTFENQSSLITHRRAKNKVECALKLFQTYVRESNLVGYSIPIEASKFLKRRGMFVHDGKKIIGDVPGIEVGDEFQYFEVLNVVGLHQLVISTGEQGNVINNQNQPRENLALMYSLYAENPVRVIIKLNSKNASGSVNGGEKYCYFGLYKVVRFWQIIGKLGYKFLLVKSPDQKKVACNDMRKRKQILKRENCLNYFEDISHGKEDFHIPMINCVDSEGVPNFRYVTQMVNLERYKPKKYSPLKGNVGCECVGNCSDSDQCSCAMKNRGKFLFNRNGIVEETKKDMIYECGHFCEIIEDEQAVKMIDNYEYLFNIGSTNHKDGVFTIDASKIPHIMLFAAEDIPQKTELTYNYNYKIDQVVDNGVVKKKYCYCGASNCIGRLY